MSLELSRPLRVIVADDHDYVREQIVALIVEELPHAEVVAVKDGRAALQEFREAGADVLVTNNQMPDMEGPVLTRKLREDEGAAIPIIAVSSDPYAEGAARQAGATEFLRKEEIPERLPALLRRYVAGA